KARRKANSHALRQKKRNKTRAAVYGHYHVRENVKKRYIDGAEALECDIQIEESSVSSTGYVGKNHGSGPRKIYLLKELVGEHSKHNFKLVRWNGRIRIPICNRNRRLIAILAGHPDDENWPSLSSQAAQALEERRRRCSIPKNKRTHRRGAFVALATGVSHGSGQTQPGNLCNPGENGKVLEELNEMEAFKRIAGHSSAVMASWVPDLYGHYVDKLGELHKKNPTLKRPFPSSVFSAATYNFGPRTVCFKHVDFANLPFGWCSVTALGSYDPTKGGHLILWDCHLVIEFPPGSTILFPSAVIWHSNVAISKEETRYSFAQYSAGGLFRWVDNHHMKADDYYASLSPEELANVEAQNQARWQFGLSLFPKL
ncbi:hypothetical protein BDZ97DRAFT_1602946, partial [Flammula alnicola]